jgi:hypothetical protein
MVDPPNIRSLGYWRASAQKARTQANQLHDPKTKQVLLNIAENYDQLAEQAEAVVGSTKPPI